MIVVWNAAQGAVHAMDLATVEPGSTGAEYVSATQPAARDLALAILASAEACLYTTGIRPFPTLMGPLLSVPNLQIPEFTLLLKDEAVVFGNGLAFLRDGDREWGDKRDGQGRLVAPARPAAALIYFATLAALRPMLHESRAFAGGGPQLDSRIQVPGVPVGATMSVHVEGLAYGCAKTWDGAHADKLVALPEREAIIAARVKGAADAALSPLVVGAEVVIDPVVEKLGRREARARLYGPIVGVGVVALGVLGVTFAGR